MGMVMRPGIVKKLWNGGFAHIKQDIYDVIKTKKAKVLRDDKYQLSPGRCATLVNRVVTGCLGI